MESADPEGADIEAEDMLQTIDEFLGGAIGEGNDKQIPWRDLTFFNQVGSTVDNGFGLTTTCPGESQYCSIGSGNYLPLLLIQSGKEINWGHEPSVARIRVLQVSAHYTPYRQRP